MKFSTTGEKIKQKISLLDKVTSKNNQLRALQTILFEVKKNKLILRATNLDVGVEVTIPVKIEKEGVVALSSSILNQFLSTLRSDDLVTFELVETNILITSSKSTTLIKTEQIEDFPILPKVTENKQEINPQDLILGFRSVFFSVAVSDIKPEIASVYIYNDNTTLCFVATDSFRLAEKKIENTKNTIDSIIFPYKNVLEVIRFFEEEKNPIELCYDKNQISLTSEGVYLTARLVNGVYPNYRQIIPTSFKTQATLFKNNFSEGLKQASVFLDEFNRLTIKTHKDDDSIEIESRNTNTGENTTQTEAHITGDDITMGFNHRYVSEVLPHITTDSVALKFIDQTRPLVITPVGDVSFLYLVMPVNR
jgi:DNA polymerase-3 subunit beta